MIKNIRKQLVTLVLLPAAAYAAEFPLPHAPKGWQGKISIPCSGGQCSGDGTVTLKTPKHSQTLPVHISGYAVNPASEKPHEVLVKFDDFNFDGKTDIAVLTGSGGPYGSLSYDVYVQTTSGRFIKSQELSDLYAGYMFVDTNRKHKLLIASGKSGAHIHFTDYYRVVSGKGLQKTYGYAVIYGGCDNEKIKLVRSFLKNGKEQESSRCLTEAQLNRLIEKEEKQNKLFRFR